MLLGTVMGLKNGLSTYETFAPLVFFLARSFAFAYAMAVNSDNPKSRSDLQSFPLVENRDEGRSAGDIYAQILTRKRGNPSSKTSIISFLISLTISAVPLFLAFYNSNNGNYKKATGLSYRFLSAFCIGFILLSWVKYVLQNSLLVDSLKNMMMELNFQTTCKAAREEDAINVVGSSREGGRRRRRRQRDEDDERIDLSHPLNVRAWYEVRKSLHACGNSVHIEFLNATIFVALLAFIVTSAHFLSIYGVPDEFKEIKNLASRAYIVTSLLVAIILILFVVTVSYLGDRYNFHAKLRLSRRLDEARLTLDTYLATQCESLSLLKDFAENDGPRIKEIKAARRLIKQVRNDLLSLPDLGLWGYSHSKIYWSAFGFAVSLPVSKIITFFIF